MNFFISIIVIAIISLVVGLYTPWWSIAIIAFLVSFMLPQKPLSAFTSGFLGVFILWLMIAVFINAANAGILANRVGALLGIGANPSLLIFITALVGGLVAGLAALTASYLRVQKA